MYNQICNFKYNYGIERFESKMFVIYTDEVSISVLLDGFKITGELTVNY